MIRRGDVFRTKSPNGEYSLVVCVVDVPESDRQGVNCMVLGGTNPTYPKGGWDLFMFYSDLKESERIEFEDCADRLNYSERFVGWKRQEQESNVEDPGPEYSPGDSASKPDA